MGGGAPCVRIAKRVEMFSKATKSPPGTAAGQAPQGRTGLPYSRLEDAARVYFLHADVALDAIGGVLGRRRVRGFTLERVVDLTEAGASVWQEAAVCDGRRLILWHSEELADASAPGGTVLDSSVQVLPLDAIGHVGMRTLVGHDDRGRRVDRGVYLVLATAMPHELSAVAVRPGLAAAGGLGEVPPRGLPVQQVPGRRGPGPDSAAHRLRAAARPPGARRGGVLRPSGGMPPPRCHASPARSSASVPARQPGDPLLQGEAGGRQGQGGDAGGRVLLHPVGDPVDRSRAGVVRSISSCGTAAAAPSLSPARYLSWISAACLLVPHAPGELVVEVLLAAAHAADVQRGVGAEGVGERGDVRRRRARAAAVGQTSKPSRVLPGLLAAGPQVPDRGVLQVLGGGEDQQGAVGDLAGLLQVLRADGGDVERDVLALRVDGELDRLAGAAGQRQRPVLALVASAARGTWPCGRSRRTRGCGPAACRT